MKLTTRNAAHEQGLTRYFTGEPCKHGHITERLVSNKRCVECANIASRSWKKENVKACSAAKLKWCERNRDRVRELKRSHYANNVSARQKQAARSRRWMENNREKYRASSANWRRNNLSRVAANQQRRRAKLLQRTAKWADNEKILRFYVLARELTEQTGIPHEVDHIYPLQGELVSGLHVETNLRVIPKSENRSKGSSLLDHHQTQT